MGLADNWLCHVRDVHAKHEARVEAAGETAARVDSLCELNVIEQVANVCQTTVVRDAWSRGQPLAVHGWIYGLRDGLIRDLDTTITGLDEVAPAYRGALEKLRAGGG